MRVRVRVKDSLDLLAAGASREEILADFPYLEPEDITASLEYAAQQADHPVLRVAEPARRGPMRFLVDAQRARSTRGDGAATVISPRDVIGTILKHDKKPTSYKLALLRSINDVVLRDA